MEFSIQSIFPLREGSSTPVEEGFFETGIRVSRVVLSQKATVFVPQALTYAGIFRTFFAYEDHWQGTIESAKFAVSVTPVFGPLVDLADGIYGLVEGRRIFSKVKIRDCEASLDLALGLGSLLLDLLYYRAMAKKVGVGFLRHLMTESLRFWSPRQGWKNGRQLFSRSPQAQGAPPPAPEGPVKVGEKVWKATFGRLPPPWNSRSAWGTGLLSGGAVLAELVLPERATPTTLLSDFKDCLFPDLGKLEEALNLRHSASLDQALEAAQKLGEIGGPKALSALQKAEYHVQDYPVKRAIGAAIDRIVEDSGWLEKYGEADTSEEKIAAIQALAQMGGRRVIRFFIKLLEKEADPQVRAHLKLSLQRVKHLAWPVIAEEVLENSSADNWGTFYLAARQVREQLGSKPKDMALRLRLAELELKLSRPQRAKALFLELAEAPDSDDPQLLPEERKQIVARAHNALGLLALKKEEEGESQGEGPPRPETPATGHFRKAVQLNPELLEAWSNLGLSLRNDGNPGAAAQAENQAILLLQEPNAARSFALGQLYLQEEEIHLAKIMFEETLSLTTKKEDLVDVYNALGVVYSWLDDWDEAFSWYDKSLALSKGDLKDKRREAVTEQLRGLAYVKQEHWGEAQGAYQEALHLFIELGERGSMATVYSEQGIMYRSMRLWKQALSVYEQAWALILELEEEAKDGDEEEQKMIMRYKAVLLNNGAIVFRGLSRPDEEEKAYQRSLALSREIGDWALVAEVHMNRTISYGFQKKYDEALEAALGFQEAAEKSGQLSTLGVAYYHVGQALSLLHRPDEALEPYRKAVEVLKNVPSQGPIFLKAAEALGSFYRSREKSKEALEAYETGLKYGEGEKQSSDLARLYVYAGLMAEKTGNLAKAESYITTALPTLKDLKEENHWRNASIALRRVRRKLRKASGCQGSS